MFWTVRHSFFWRIISVKICLSLHRNKKQTVKSLQYDWSSLTNSDSRNQYTVTVKNKFDTLQETSERHPLNDEYEKFITAYIEEAAKCILSKPRARCKVPWKSIAVRENWDYMKKYS